MEYSLLIAEVGNDEVLGIKHVLAAIAGLCAVIVWQAKRADKSVEKIEERSEKIEAKYDKAADEAKETAVRLGKLEVTAKIAGEVVPKLDKISEGVEALGVQFLEEIKTRNEQS